LDKTALDDAAMLSADLEVPDFLIEEDMQNEFEAPEFEVESNLQTNAEKEEISEEDLLGLFDDIKEIDMPEKDTSGNQKLLPRMKLKCRPTAILWICLMKLEFGIKRRKSTGYGKQYESTSKEAEESDSAIDELLELREFIDSSQNSEKDSIESSGGKSGKKQMKKISVTYL